MAKLGIMQGRLVPPEPGRFQAFPKLRWRDEFVLAAEVPLSHIEWIYDLYGADVNPLTEDRGALNRLTEASGVSIKSICADYFMDFPFVRCSEDQLAERQQHLHRLLGLAQQTGIERVVLPFVDVSRIESAEDRQTAVRIIRDALPVAHETGVEIHLETSLDPVNFARLLDRLPDHMVKVNYDSGNSASLGFLPSEEFDAYGDRVGSVHIKDRLRDGGTVPLGSGDADFPGVFAGLEKIEYKGDITLQVARATPGQEAAWARENRTFVARYWALD